MDRLTRIVERELKPDDDMVIYWAAWTLRYYRKKGYTESDILSMLSSVTI